MLSEHGVTVTEAISRDLLHLQIQFLISMLALNFILLLLILIIYRYMKYREYRGEMDYLTGVMGRRLFLHHCKEIQTDGTKNETRMGWFLFLDVDWFKKINDTFGHTVGDETLKKIAQSLQNILGSYGAVGRVGGDEFAVIIEVEMSREELEEKLKSFLEEISGILSEVTVSCSIGACHFKFPQEVKQLLTETDHVLYKAKAHRRACFVIQE